MKDDSYILAEHPHVHLDKISNEEIEVKIHFTVEPIVKLGTYKGLTVEKELVSVLDEEIEERISNLREQNAELIIKEEGEVVNGDTVIIDFEGFVDGKAFEGGKAENYQLVIGSNTFIPGFEDQIIGMKNNEEKDINVVFPEQYAPNLASKPAVFKVKLHEIKYNKLPEVNDDLALDANIENVSNLEELKEHYRKSLFQSKENDSKNAALGKIFDLVIKSSEIEIADSMIEKEKEHTISHIKEDLEKQGMTMDNYLENLKLTNEQFEEKVKEESLRNISFAFVIMKIAENENISVTEEEIENTLNQVAAMYGQKIEEVKKALKDRMNGLRQDMLYSKVYEFLKKENNII